MPTSYVEAYKVVPNTRYGPEFREWLKKHYYPTEWWKHIRQLVYDYRHGVCGHCGGEVKRTWFNAHHGTKNGESAYDHLWEEDKFLYLMDLMHPECHTQHHESYRTQKAYKQMKFSPGWKGVWEEIWYNATGTKWPL